MLFILPSFTFKLPPNAFASQQAPHHFNPLSINEQGARLHAWHLYKGFITLCFLLFHGSFLQWSRKHRL